MAQYDITPERTFNTPYAADERVTVFLRSVYAWMCAGLGSRPSWRSSSRSRRRSSRRSRGNRLPSGA